MLEYRVGEIFRLNGATYRCVTDYVRATEPEEGMLFLASNGVLYELKTIGSTCEKCGCDTNLPNNLPCRVIDRQAFGKTQINSLHWYPVEEKKEEEKEMEEKKRHIELAVVSTGDYVTTLRIVEQTHRNDNFSQQEQRNAFVSSQGFQLISDKYPKNTKTPDELYKVLVRGTDADMDDNTFEVDTILLGFLWQAITEYNDTDGAGYK